MKPTTTSILATLVLIGFHTGCERHPASQTIPGYAEKLQKAEEKAEKKASHSERTDASAPSYFPSKQN